MMKKITALLLVLVLVFSAAACSSSEPTIELTPEEAAFAAYTEMFQRLSLDAGESGAYDIDFTIEIYMNFLGESVLSVSHGNMQMIVDDEHVMVVMLMEMDMSQLGEPNVMMELFMEVDGDQVLAMRMYMDGVDYSDMFPPEMLEDMIDEITSSAIDVPDFTYDALQSAEIFEVDGNTEFHMILSGDELADFTREAMEEQLAMFEDLGGIEIDLSFEDVLMIVVVDADDNPVSMTMDMALIMTLGGQLAELDGIDGEAMEMRMVMSMYFNGFGDNVQIERV